jgi:HK97 gp10 family phage protein
MPITDWNPRRVKAMVSGNVVRNMDRACQFAVEEAKANVRVRTGTVQFHIAYEVEARGDVVEGRVGVEKGEAFYGYFLELGTRKMSARPFLRPAVFGNAATIVRIIEGKQ